MDKIYYIIINGRQEGPMNPEELLRAGMKSDSPVWREGLADWTMARTIPELAVWLEPSLKSEQSAPVAPVASPVSGPFAPPSTPYPYPAYGTTNLAPRRSRWMTAAIIATVLGSLFSCIGLIFGIVAIVQANNANQAYARGDVYDGERCDNSAKTWTIVTYVITFLGLAASLIWFFASLVSALGSL